MTEKHQDRRTVDDGPESHANGAPPDTASETHHGFDGAVAAEPADELDQLRRLAADAQDRYLRSQADLDNTRKRLRREMDEERRYAELPLLADLLPVIDNVNRAVEAAQKNADAESLLAGFKMVSQQLNSVLEKHHCRPIQAEGQPFDPTVHEAIMQQPSGEHPENTVMAVGQTGYKVHDRVLRPAQVVVSKKSG